MKPIYHREQHMDRAHGIRRRGNLLLCSLLVDMEDGRARCKYPPVDCKGERLVRWEDVPAWRSLKHRDRLRRWLRGKQLRFRATMPAEEEQRGGKRQ